MVMSLRMEDRWGGKRIYQLLVLFEFVFLAQYCLALIINVLL